MEYRLAICEFDMNRNHQRSRGTCPSILSSAARDPVAIYFGVASLRASLNVHDGPGHERSAIRAQERDHLGDLLGAAKSTDRQMMIKIFLRLGLRSRV